MNDRPLYIYNIVLGATLLYTGRLMEAQACFEQVIAIAPDQVQSFVNLKTVYAEQGPLYIYIYQISQEGLVSCEVIHICVVYLYIY
jgi:hypothetical protein